MKALDRLVAVVALAVPAAVVLSVVVTPLITLAVVLTGCFVTVEAVRYLTRR